MARARKTLRIRRISLLSAAWIGALFGFVQGVLQSLLLATVPALLQTLTAEDSDVELGGFLRFLATLGFGLLLVAPVAGLVLGALWALVVALILNIALALMGGFALEVE